MSTAERDLSVFQGSEILFKSLIRYGDDDRWPGTRTPDHERKRSIFGTSTPGNTIALLRHELKMIDAAAPEIAMAINERDVTRAGYPRADARPKHPGVVLSFDSNGQRLVYPCDTFTTWQANLRAIALTLEALRKPTRYRVLQRGEQYAGNRLLTAGGTTTTMGVREAAAFIARAIHPNDPTGQADLARMLERSHVVLDSAYKEAARRSHPDAGGSAEKMDLLTKARETLRAHHGSAAR